MTDMSKREWCGRYQLHFHRCVTRRDFTKRELTALYAERDVTLTPEQAAEAAAILWGGEK
jgi:hypothetical protein